MAPKRFCCMRKYFWLCPTTTFTSKAEMGITNKAISVMGTLMESIITSTPMMVAVEVMSWVTPWFRLWPSVSMSLVMRESTSPVLVRSKYPMGSASIFCEMR